MSEKLMCLQKCRNETCCDLPVTQVSESGLVVMNRHWHEKHINLIPFDWLIEQMVGIPAVREKIEKELDKLSN